MTLQDSFEEINDLIERKIIKIDDKTYHLEFFLGGDYKFLLLLMGMKNATSNYSCLWCKIPKDDRWKMDFDLAHYNSNPLKRTLEEIKEMANKAGTKDKYSCENTQVI